MKTFGMENSMDGIVTLFDTETTGLIRPDATDIVKQPYITEIFCLKVRQKNDQFEIVEEFEQLINVPIPLDKDITRITGIDDAMLADKPEFSQVYPRLAKFMTGTDRLVAHNMAFDSSMLANELVRIGKVIQFPWPRHQICTVEKSMGIEQRRMKLQSLHEHLFGEPVLTEHEMM